MLKFAVVIFAALVTRYAGASTSLGLTCVAKSSLSEISPAAGANATGFIRLNGGEPIGSLNSLNFLDQDGTNYDYSASILNITPQVTATVGDGGTALRFDYSSQAGLVKRVTIIIDGNLVDAPTTVNARSFIWIEESSGVLAFSDATCTVQ
jgi:hypothetical protein